MEDGFGLCRARAFALLDAHQARFIQLVAGMLHRLASVQDMLTARLVCLLCMYSQNTSKALCVA
jgi:hypothetical protein